MPSRGPLHDEGSVHNAAAGTAVVLEAVVVATVILEVNAKVKIKIKLIVTVKVEIH